MRKVPQVLFADCALLSFYNMAFTNRTDSTEVKPQSIFCPTIMPLAVGKREMFENSTYDISFSFQNSAYEFTVADVVLHERSIAESVLNKIHEFGNGINTLAQGACLALPNRVKHIVNEVDYEIGIAKATVMGTVSDEWTGSCECSTSSIKQYLIESHPKPLLLS